MALRLGVVAEALLRGTTGARRTFAASARAAASSGSAGTRGSLWKDFVDKVKSGLAEDKDLQENLRKLDEEKKKLAEKKAVRKATEAAQRVKEQSVAGGSVLKDKIGKAASGSGKKIGSATSAARASAADAINKAASSSVGKTVGSSMGKTVSQVSSKVSRAASKASSRAETVAKSQTAERLKAKTEAFARDYILDPREEADMSEERSKSDSTPGVRGSAMGLAEVGVETPTEAFLNKYKDTRLVKGALALTESMRESDNKVVSGMRGAFYSVSDAFSQVSDKLFPETEAAMCYSEIRRLDPDFDEYRLQSRLERYTLPEVMDALGKNDLATLKTLVSPKLYQVLEQTLPPASANRIHETHILHLTPLEMIAIKPVEKEPTLFYSFTAQQIAVVRDAAGNVVDGDPDAIQQVQFIWAVQRDKKDPTVWALVEMQALDPEEAMF